MEGNVTGRSRPGIAYLSRSIVPSRLANSVHVMKMSRAFVACGREVTLVCQRTPGDQLGLEDICGFYGVEPSFRLVRLARGRLPGYQLAYGWRACQEARRAGSEVLAYCRDLWSCLFAAARGLHVALEVHSMDVVATQSRRIALRRIMRSRNFGFIVVISKALEDDLLERVPELRGRTLVAHDAADIVSDELLPLHRTRIREGFSVGYTGHLYRGRGIPLILEIAARAPWAVFHVVGGNPLDVERLRGDVAERELSNIVVHGFVPPGQLDRLRATFDVVIAPYERRVSVDGGGDTTKWMSPMKIFEYMALGLPIVCSDLPVLREVLTDGVTAILVPPEDPAAWLAALVRLRDDPEFARRIGWNALMRQRSEFNWTARARSILEFWSRCL